MILNLPYEQRVAHENILFPAIIPGPTQPKNINSFLLPIIDELNVMRREGFSVEDFSVSHQRTELPPVLTHVNRNIKSYLLYVVGDHKAMVKVSETTYINSANPISHTPLLCRCSSGRT